MAAELRGWLLDVYADRGRGAVVWFVDENGRRHRFTQKLAITFYAGGEWAELEMLCAYLRRANLPHWNTRRKHLFHGWIEVIAIRVVNGALQRSLFRSLHGQFPHVDYYNADLALPLHYFVGQKTFPLAFCTLNVTQENEILGIVTHDDKWSISPNFPDLRVMEVQPSDSPKKTLPRSIRVKSRNYSETLVTKQPLQLLRRFAELIELYDPDVIRTQYGDMWLFPYLFSISESTRYPFNPNRDKTLKPIRVGENQFESYGRLVHRDQQTLLHGRLHIDPLNSMAFNDWGLEGVYETAQLSNLPVQNAARRSAGGAFVGMQIAASLEKGILIPIRKQQRERFKKATQLIAADNGGVIFKPIVGLHNNVAEIDFFSMYPHIMTSWNISAETVGVAGDRTLWAPGIGVPINQDHSGIVASILKPVLAKRRAIKDILEHESKQEGHQLEYLKTAYEFLKGLGWVSYGYQGFSGNRIGSIEAHETINAVSREVILRAKETAEEAGFEVLHLYVDSLFIAIGGNGSKLDDLLIEIQRRTQLRIDLEGILRWIAFLPSKQNEALPVPNCYFGVFDDGRLKCRGIMARRGDTPGFIADAQMEAIEMLKIEPVFNKLRDHIPELVEFFKGQHEQLKAGAVDPQHLVVSQTLSRNLDDYQAASPAGRAALQLADEGKTLSAGQTISYLRIKQPPFVQPWYRTENLTGSEIDADWYGEQLTRAADEILSPFGVPKSVLTDWIQGKPGYWRPAHYLRKAPHELPLIEQLAVRDKIPGFVGKRGI